MQAHCPGFFGAGVRNNRCCDRSIRSQRARDAFCPNRSSFLGRSWFPEAYHVREDIFRIARRSRPCQTMNPTNLWTPVGRRSAAKIEHSQERSNIEGLASSPDRGQALRTAGLSMGITQTLDVDAAWEASFDSCFHELRRKENASESVRLTWRRVRRSRFANWPASVTEPLTILSSQRRPGVMALTRRARRSARSGRTFSRRVPCGSRILRKGLVP